MLEYRTIRGVSLAFEWIDNGGELIVFIHGVGADRTSWEPQVKFFSQLGYSVAAIDMRGSGDSDGILPSSSVEWFRTHLKSATIEVLAGCGHLPQMEQRAAVVARVRQFLAGIG